MRGAASAGAPGDGSASCGGGGGARSSGRARQLPPSCCGAGHAKMRRLQKEARAAADSARSAAGRARQEARHAAERRQAVASEAAAAAGSTRAALLQARAECTLALGAVFRWGSWAACTRVAVPTPACSCACSPHHVLTYGLCCMLELQASPQQQAHLLRRHIVNLCLLHLPCPSAALSWRMPASGRSS